MNTKYEEAIEKLLEKKGYTIYEIDVYQHSMIIEGSVDYGNQYDFKVDIPLPIVRDEGKSAIDMIIGKIKEYTNDIDKYTKELSEKKEFKSKQYANEILTEMFERGIKEETNVCVGSDIVGRKEGKTSTVTYLAQKYNLPIVVSNSVYKNLFKKIDKNLEVHVMSTSVAGLTTKIVLVDELEKNNTYYLTEMGYIVIGVVR
ncbi:hypothetical protein [Staphylococcus phage PT1-4]